MSRIQELLDELCPNGVEYKKISELLNSLTTGLNPRKNFVLNEQGATQPYITGKDVFNNTINISERTDKIKKEVVELINKRAKLQDNIILFASTGTGTVGRMAYIEKYDGTWNISETLYVINLKWELIVPKYFMYVVNSSLAKAQYEPKISKGSVPHLKISDLVNVNLPIPPIEVQNEIVNILDKFTAVTEEIKRKLEEELEARKKQYEYYKDSLLPFDKEEVSWMTLGDISTISRGASPRPIKNFITTSEDGVNWIKIGDVASGEKYITSTAEKITAEGAKKSRCVKPGDFIMSNSMSFGRPYILQIEGCIHDGWLSITGFEEYVTSDYLYHILTSSYIQKIMKQKASFGGAVQNLNADIVRCIEIPVPSKEYQNKVVTILDRFSSLYTDMQSSIPAEIDARKKQYEYYRDKLLSFKELGA